MRVCIVTPGQPANNPRFVKEADALTEAGHTVHAVCSDCGLWPSTMDASVMTHRRWSVEYAGGTAAHHPARYALMRLRHGASRRIWQRAPAVSVLQRWALLRAAPELEKAASQYAADLYIAHHPWVLPIAARAAARHSAVLGYDIEDLYADMYPWGTAPSRLERLIEQIEARYLPRCGYVTAASPAFADLYAKRYCIARPTPVLNVFPLAERPKAFRTTGVSGPLRLYWFSQAIGPGRGLEEVLAAIASLKDRHFELHLRGNWQQGYRQQLLAFARRQGVDPQIVISYPPAPPSEMVSLAADFDIGLCVEQPVDYSRPYGITNKTFVCLLAGNAMVSTNNPGQRVVLEVIGTAAFSYAPGDVNALAGGLKTWYDDRAALDVSRRAAWEWGANRYNWDMEKQTFLDTVHRVCTTGDSLLQRNCA